MKTPYLVGAATALLALGACHASTGSQVEHTYDNAADRLDAMADNAATEGNQSGEAALANQADALRNQGDELKDSLKDAPKDDVITSNKN